MTHPTLKEIVEHLGDEVLALDGTTDTVIERPSPIDDAPERGAISFWSGDVAAAAAAISQSNAEAIVCSPDVVGTGSSLGRRPKTLIRVANPRRSFIRIVGAFFAPPKPTGVHPTAVVDPQTELGDDVRIGPFACVEATKVGGGSVIHGHVHIYPGVRIGRNVTIHAGAVIGADGYGYERNEAGELEKFPHLGGVVIEDDAEIGANACIDRGTLGDTVISEGAKIDDLVYVAHNVTVGRHAVVIALSAIAGGARIGDRAWIAPGAAVRDKQSVGADARVGIGAAVLEDVPSGSTVAGVPARPLNPPTRT